MGQLTGWVIITMTMVDVDYSCLFSTDSQPKSGLGVGGHQALSLFFSRPRSEGWPRRWRTFSIYPCPLLFWLTLPREVLLLLLCMQILPSSARHKTDDAKLQLDLGLRGYSRITGSTYWVGSGHGLDCGPDIGNSLPVNIRLTDSHAAFRRTPKTHLINIAF